MWPMSAGGEETGPAGAHIKTTAKVSYNGQR